MLHCDQPLWIQNGFGLCIFGTGCCDQNIPFFIACRIANVDLQKETVQLRFRQRICAFLLDRVLRSQDMKGRWQSAILSGNGHMVFLHRLQQC